MFKQSPHLYLCAFLLIAFSGSQRSRGQAPDGVVADQQGNSSVRLRLDFGFSHQFETDIDDGGEFDLTRSNIGVGVAMELTDTLKLDNYVSFELDSYDFSGSTGFGGLDPWEDIQMIRFRALFTLDLDGPWSLLTGPLLWTAAEDDASMSNSFTGGGLIGATYRKSETFTITGGLAVLSQIDDDTAVFPFIFMNWIINDDWTLRTGPMDLGSAGGLGLELVTDLVDDWQFAFGGQFLTRRFRLDDKGVAPDGVGESTSLPLYAKLTWNPKPDMSVDLIGGVVVGGELRLEDDNGSKISEEDFDPAGLIGVRLRCRF